MKKDAVKPAVRNTAPHRREGQPLPQVTLQDLLNASEGVSQALTHEHPVASSPLSPQELDQLRRSVDLRIDAEGRWWHEGELFTHQRLISYFNRQLGWREGEATLTIGERWCYVGCDVTPFLILKIEGPDPAGELWAHLNTGERYALAELELRSDVLFSQLTPSRLARFSRHAQGQCGAWLCEQTPNPHATSPSYMLALNGRRWMIKQD